MRSPLRKRLLRELRGELGKYLVIFLLLTLSISFLSGYLVASGSMISAYEESFEKYNVEDGHFAAVRELNRAQRKAVNALGIRIYDLYYAEQVMDNGSTLRLYPPREEVNRICLMRGALPASPGEIALDRMYAENNDIGVGDALAAGERQWRVTGLVAFSDYSSLFSDNGDTMFDALKFGVGVLTAEEFAAWDRETLSWVYAWKYDDPPADEAEEHQVSQELMKALVREVKLSDYVPRYANQAIQFAGNDLSGDRAMMMVLLCIVIVIMAFVQGIVTGNAVTREAAVIGTLRASGYTRRELLAHYMALPVLVTLFSALVGNVLGYTLLKDFCASMYYGSYSLPTYVTLWSGEAFVFTTAAPLSMMTLISYFMLRRRLRLPPLKLLRRELSARRQRRALPLSPRLPFMSRFRLRVVLQNLGGYTLLLAGVLFANFLLLFGLAMPAVLDNYQERMQQGLLAEHQYMLKIPYDAMDEDHRLRAALRMMQFLDAVDTETPGAERFSAFTLRTLPGSAVEEDVILYGVEPGSEYVALSAAPGEAWISRACAEKYRLAPGDTLSLRERYGERVRRFSVRGVYPYDGAIAVFMDRASLNVLMEEDKDYFCGYFSHTPITDIEDKYLGAEIDLEALTKISRQLDRSMGDLMYLVDGFSVVIFLVLIYILSKLIIERNAHAISMTKILGYAPREIRRLYMLPTSVLAAVFLAGSLPLENLAMEAVFRHYICQRISGWMGYDVPPRVFLVMLALGLGAYALVAALEYRRIGRIPMDEALKNVE